MKVEITVNTDGQVEVDVHGGKGKACTDVTKAIEKALHAEVLEKKMKPEYYQQVVQERRQR